jgi:heptosyltransferase-3
MEAFQNILVIRGGAIGDFILTLPVLAGLRNNFPGSRLELLAVPSVAAIAVEFGLADKVRDINSLSFTPLFSLKATCSAETSTWLSNFDLIISYAHDPERVFETNLRKHSTAQIIVGPHRPVGENDLHASLQLFEPLRSVNCIPFDVGRWTLNVGSSSSTHIAIHPGSGSPNKNWPEEYWRDLLHHLVSTTDDTFLIIGGEAERDRLPSLAQVIPTHRRLVALDLPFVELAHQLQNCRAFIGHDSGITHLAAVLGLDCIVLWGPTNEQVWRPLGPNIHLIQCPDGLSFLPMKHVVNALNSLLVTA